MASIQQAVLRVIEGPLPPGAREANNPLFLCLVETESGIERAVLKLVSRPKVVAEAAAFLTAKHLGLPTLGFFLTEVPEGFAPPAGLAFPATPFQAATRYENISSLADFGVGWDSPFWKSAVASEWFGRIIAFDVLIGNFDRPLRNVLFRGTAPGEDFVVADHDRIFHAQSWSPPELAQSCLRAGSHHFARFNRLLNGPAREKLTRTAEEFSKTFRDLGPPELASLAAKGLASSFERKAIRRFFEYRASVLPALVEKVLASA